MEKPVSFRSNSHKVSGVLHLPDGRPPFPGAVFLHGFAGSRVEAHRLFVKAARQLAETGIASLRFDFRGCGESEGELGNMSVTEEIRDAVRAFDFFRRHRGIDVRRLGLLGFSLGAALAFCLARRRPRVKCLALWSPLAQLQNLFTLPTGFKQREIRQWISDGHIAYRGEKLGGQWLMDLAWHDPLKDAAAFKGKALIVRGEKDRATPLGQARLYQQRLGSRARLYVIPGADHSFNRPEWESEALSATVQWLRKEL